MREDSEGQRARPEVIGERDRRGSEKTEVEKPPELQAARQGSGGVVLRRPCFGCRGTVRRNKILVHGLGFDAGRKTTQWKKIRAFGAII
ncbi:hypothetical protein U1Q18_018841 [Sarracenia purpurea var. burkii]